MTLLYGFKPWEIGRLSLYQFAVYCGANTKRKVGMSREEAMAFRAGRQTHRKRK